MAYMAESNGAKRSKLDEDSRVSTKYYYYILLFYFVFTYFCCASVFFSFKQFVLVDMVVVDCCLT